jgi:hypothetical protein
MSDSEMNLLQCTPPEVLKAAKTAINDLVPTKSGTIYQTAYSRFLSWYCCDQKILDTNVIVLSYILKRPLCINNLNFDCVNFENVNVRFTEKIFKKL